MTVPRTCDDAYMTDRTAVLLARADCRDDPVALAVCDMFLRMLEEPGRVLLKDRAVPEGDR